MAKVLVERPRLDSRWRKKVRKGYRKQVRREIETHETQPRESIREHCPGWPLFGEHLGPLRRYVEKQTGRAWIRVHAEIFERIDPHNVVQKHILTHLFDYVVIEVELIGGRPYYSGNRKAYPVYGPNRWYVCPRTGILKPAPHRPKRDRSEPPKIHVWVDAKTLVRKRDDGRWEEILVQSLRHIKDATPVKDVVFGIRAQEHTQRLTEFYGKPVYAVAVRILQTYELGRLPIPIDYLKKPLKAPNVVR